VGEIDEKIQESVERAEAQKSSLNSVIAALVAAVATLMAIFNIKDGNIVQAMAQAQTASVDTWAYYQSKSTKQNLAEGMVDELMVQRDLSANLSPQSRQVLEAKIAEYTAAARRYEGEKNEIKAKAEEYQRQYDRLNIHDDQFDMAEAGMSIAIALLGITALTQKRWLLGFAVVFAAFGAVLGLAGFLGWTIHPESLARLLS
jgi:peptide subunit release factor 1 (eRF1)